jgi:hypothetical protein
VIERKLQSKSIDNWMYLELFNLFIWLELPPREKLHPELNAAGIVTMGELEGQAKRLHSFWPRGREFNSWRAHFEKILIVIFILLHAMPIEHSLLRTKWARHWHYSTIKNLASMKMASCYRKSKNDIKIELFDKARTSGRFLNQRHIESTRGFDVIRGVECLSTHCLLKPRSMASSNLQIFRKDFSRISSFFTTKFRNLARLKIDPIELKT